MYKFLIILIIPISAFTDQPTAKVSNSVKTFINDYCVNCHGPKKQKGKVRLDKLKAVISNGAEAQIWQDVLDIINTGDMPPEESRKVPADKILTNVVGSLTEDLLKARRILADKGGETVTRRMNELEYINSIETLTGIRLPEDMVPDDENGKEFNTLGWYQTFSPATLEAYEKAAEYAVRRILIDGTKPYLKKEIERKDNAAAQRRQKQQALKKMTRTHHQALEVPKSTKDLQKYGFKNETFYKRALKPIAGQFGVPQIKYYLNNPNSQTGTIIYDMNMGPLSTSKSFESDFRGKYILRAKIAAEKEMDSEYRFLTVKVNQQPVGYLSVTGSLDKPQIFEMEIRPGRDKTEFRLNVIGKTDLRNANRMTVNKGGYVPGFWVNWIEIEGPFYDGRYKKKRTELLQNIDEQTLSESSIKTILRKFADKAFRGAPVQEQLINDLLTIYRQELSVTKNETEALIKPMSAILTTPEFLYLGINKVEGQRKNSKSRLSGSEMASRLSFMLWKEPPSEILLKNSDKFIENKFFEQTIDEMLESPKANRFIEQFFSQWLGLIEYDHIVLNSKKYVFFDKSRRDSVKKQPLEFIRYIIKNDLSLLNLIDSEFTLVNSVMARLYDDLKQSKELQGTKFVKVALGDKSRHRGGILGMPIVHTIGSTGERNAPVERGAWILRKLLNSPPPPPPPNVEQLESKDKSLTIREKLEKHKDIPQCYSCHRKIDDLGLSMENFDVIGRWNINLKNETAGLMPDGTSFQNFNEMKTRLMSKKDKMIEGLIQALIAYSLSRESEFSDQDFVEAVVKETKENGYRLKPLLKAFIMNEKFTHK